MELLAPMDSGESGAAGVAGLIAACREPALRRELGIGPQTRVLAINTEGRA
jgi:diaminopropionate ammonia-lyase